MTTDSVVYRDTPCAEGERAVVLPSVKASVRADHGDVRTEYSDAKPALQAARPQSAATPAAASPLQAGSRSVLPAAGTPISVGMSDLEVLNLRGWGRPTRITRSKSNGVWREEWLYAGRGDGPSQLLQFSNARLAAIETESDTAQQQIVHLTGR